MSNKLTIKFTEQQVKQLFDYNKSLAVLRAVNMSNKCKNGFSNHIAWCVSKISMNIEISWEDAIQVYASENGLDAGTVIFMTAYKNANPKSSMYTYMDGYFSESEYSGENGNYYIKNGASSGKIIGLAQSFTINGVADETYPINARKMMASEEAFFYETNGIGLCLVTGAQSGQVIVVSDAAVSNIALSSDESAVITYDSNSNSFTKA